jgi:hypothetical protein
MKRELDGKERVDAVRVFPLVDAEIIKLDNRSNDIADDLSKLAP